MTTEMVLTDEQIASLLNDVLRASGSSLSNYTMQMGIDRMKDSVRAIEQAVLQAYESQLLRLLVNIRFAAGDNGLRMQPELVEHIRALRKDAERYRWLRSDAPEPDLIIEDMYESALCGEDLDAAIDAAMEKRP